MKYVKYFCLFLIIILSSEMFSQFNDQPKSLQLGKPQYNIRCYREGVFLGDIKIELFSNVAPLHTRNFDSLVNIHFYDTTAFHRVVPNFVIQGGDPNSRHGDPSTWGFGDSSQTNVPAEFSSINHARGTLGAARDEDINSANSQFFINVAENSGLNNRYTVYGAVYEGMNIADSIVNSPTVPGTERPVKKIEMFITYLGVNNSVPSFPSLISPINGKDGVSGSQNFEWTAVNDAVLYRLQISKDSTFSTLDYEYLVGRNSRVVPDFPLGPVKFFWRVQANNGGHLSQFSEVFTFTTSIKAPVLTSPSDSSMGVSTSPLFRWNPVEGATGYKLLVATSVLFSAASTVINQSGISSTSYQASGLLPNKKYYWKVKGLTPTYEGVYSLYKTFTTGSAVSISDDYVPKEFLLEQNFPNPFNPYTIISFALPEKSHVSLKVFNIQGKEIMALIDEEIDAGKYSVTFDGSHLSSGVYFYTLKAISYTESKNMILLK